MKLKAVSPRTGTRKRNTTEALKVKGPSEPMVHTSGPLMVDAHEEDWMPAQRGCLAAWDDDESLAQRWQAGR